MSPISADAVTENRLRPSPALLGPSERAEIAGAVSQLITNWSVELSQEAPPTTTIMISPDDGEDTSGPTVVISADNGVFRLDAFQWDRYWTIAEYQTWAEAISAVCKVVAWESAVARTIH